MTINTDVVYRLLSDQIKKVAEDLTEDGKARLQDIVEQLRVYWEAAGQDEERARRIKAHAVAAMEICVRSFAINAKRSAVKTAKRILEEVAEIGLALAIKAVM
jgi:F420-dependent methylenetetrahydromethanopterin dehydrogenase